MSKDFFKNILENGSSSGLCNLLQDALNNLKSNDRFGTEGQLDPRGDFREAVEKCDECFGEGCDYCDWAGFYDSTDDMEYVGMTNVDSVIREILKLPDDLIQEIFNELFIRTQVDDKEDE